MLQSWSRYKHLAGAFFTKIVQKLCSTQIYIGNRKVPILQYLCDSRYFSILLKVLLYFGADVNRVDSEGYTPLLSAYMHQRYQTMYQLLNHGAEISICDRKGFDIFLLECKYGQDIGWIHMLIDRFDISINREVYETFQTALHFACETSNTQLVELLIENNANVHATDTLGVTPMWYALQCDPYNLDIFEILLNRNADPNKSRSYSDCVKPIEYLCRNHSDAFGAIKCFLEYGGDPNEFSEDTGILTFLCKQERVNVGLIILLLQYGANPNPSNDGVDTPLYQACMKNELNVMRALVNYGARVEVNRIETIFQNLSSEGFIYYVRQCAKYVDLKEIDYEIHENYTCNTYSGSLLHYVCYYGYEFVGESNINGIYKIVNFLVGKIGFHINLKNEMGDTPLHYLVYGMEDFILKSEDAFDEYDHPNIDVEKILVHMIKKGADPTIQNEKGKSVKSMYYDYGGGDGKLCGSDPESEITYLYRYTFHEICELQKNNSEN